MRKSLAYILLAAGAIVAASASTLSFAADAAAPEPAAPNAASTHPSHREMHQMQQTNGEEQRSSDTAEDQATSDDQAKGDAQPQNADQNQGDEQTQAGGMVQTQASAPVPSQRSMHQQLREATRNQSARGR